MIKINITLILYIVLRRGRRLFARTSLDAIQLLLYLMALDFENTLSDELIFRSLLTDSMEQT